METRFEKMADITILVLSGKKLDDSNFISFKQNVAPALTPNQKMIFDMSQLQFIDSTGLGALLSCFRKLHAVDGKLKLFGLSNRVRRIFELVRMHHILEIYNTREEACSAFL